MRETLVILVAAHLLGDFVLPLGRLAERSQSPGASLLRAVITAATVTLFLGVLHPQIFGLILATYLTVDIATHLANSIAKVRLSDRVTWFIGDQLAHLGVLLALASFYSDAASAGWWVKNLPKEIIPWYYAGLSLVSGIVLIVPVGGILVGRLTAPFTAEISQFLATRNEEHHTGLTNGGRFIGWMERALVLLLVLIGQPNGIGFLLAAKSILRFGEIKERKDRMFAEYVLIGTFLSFGWALLVAVLTQQIIDHWLCAPG